MNPEQTKSAIRSILIGISCLVAGWVASKGYMSQEQVSAILTSPVAAALATAVASGVWGVVNKTEKNSVAIVNEIAKQPDSPVKGVVTEATPAGRELAASIPGALVVTAGTAEAAKLVAK